MLNPNDAIPLAGDHSLAIGILVAPDNPKQKHVALIFQDENQQPMLVHLAWHKKVQVEEWNYAYCWIEFEKLARDLAETFADWILISSPKIDGMPIPYSLVYEGERGFGLDGGVIDAGDGSGFTCATFILALFNDFGMPLVNHVDWPVNRPGDSEWAYGMLNSLVGYALKKDPMALPNFFQQCLRVHTLKRFRPEEVLATAWLYEGVKLEFVDIEPVGQALVEELRGIFS